MGQNRKNQDVHAVQKMTSDKRVRALITVLMEDGWEFVRLSGTNHPILRWPTAEDAARQSQSYQPARITLPLTPSDNRAVLNCLSDARRISGVNHKKNLRDR